MSMLSDLLALGEGSTVEFKRSLRSDLGREICAFANATGGVILLGVDDDGTVRGVEGHNRLKSQVQSVARSADPPISVELESMRRSARRQGAVTARQALLLRGQVLRSRRGVVAADVAGRDPGVLFRGGCDPVRRESLSPVLAGRRPRRRDLGGLPPEGEDSRSHGPAIPRYGIWNCWRATAG